MPITKQAIKKLRRDKKAGKLNASKRRQVREVLKSMRSKPTKKGYSELQTTLDKAVKSGIIHKNKAARLKSRTAKLLKK